MLDHGTELVTKTKTPTDRLVEYDPKGFRVRTYTEAEAALLESMMVRLIPTDPAHRKNVSGRNLPVNPNPAAREALSKASKLTRERIKTNKPISQVVYEAMSLNHLYTVAQLCSLTGLGREQVNNALRHLREYGKAKSAGYVASAGLYAKISE